jgi:hypothetical protein
LYQSCEKCCRGQTEYEADEPIGIDSDIGGRWNKCGVRLRRSERDGDPAQDEGRKLLGDLGEERDPLLKVIHHLLFRIRLPVKASDGVDDKRSKRSGK